MNDFIVHDVTDRTSIRALVVMGGVPREAIKELESLVVEVIGTGLVKVMNSINPAVVVAQGAAMYARHIAQRPDVYPVNIDKEKVAEHDEL